MAYPTISDNCFDRNHAGCGEHNVDEAVDYALEAEEVCGGNFCICYCHDLWKDGFFNWQWYEETLIRKENDRIRRQEGK